MQIYNIYNGSGEKLNVTKQTTSFCPSGRNYPAPNLTYVLPILATDNIFFAPLGVIIRHQFNNCSPDEHTTYFLPTLA